MVRHLSSDAFSRSLGQRTHRLAWLLGAGASASAGVPTAADMIADFKARLFCAHTNTPRNEVDASDPLWEQRITSYFDGVHSFPLAGDPCEYSTPFETAYPAKILDWSAGFPVPLPVQVHTSVSERSRIEATRRIP